MKKILLLLILITLLLTACASNDSRMSGTDIEVSKPWARSAMMGGNGAAYMLLQNRSNENDALVGASSDVAGAVEIHLSQMNADGMMEMIQQESIPLPANGEVELKPGGYHVMLVDLKQDLKAGDEIFVILHFKSHEDMTLTIPVMDAEGMGGAGMDGHMP
jgi:periplasmic copper chaperone A